jgi:hypothetical protein
MFHFGRRLTAEIHIRYSLVSGLSILIPQSAQIFHDDKEGVFGE